MTHNKNNLFYQLKFSTPTLDQENQEAIEYLLNKLDIYYDMADSYEMIRHCGSINRKIINQIVQLGFHSCTFKIFTTREITITKDYCKEYNDYATGKIFIKGLPQIYPINKENDDWVPNC